MDYNEAIAYIHSTYRFGSKLGLENMRRLLGLMEDPQKELEFIHIAGTNGKGSTASFISHALMETGLLVGTYTSPFIVEFNERIKLDFDNISNDDLAQITEFVKSKVDILVLAGENHPTEFEIVTCIAFEYFKRKKCDIVVLEVGLGGRFDATNIIDTPVCAVITKIGYDHKEYLGDTLEKIAFEKAGIIKNSIKVFTCDQLPEAMSVIQEACRQRGCALTVAAADYKLISRDIDSQVYEYKGKQIRIPLRGEHQIKNSILAYEVLKEIGVPDDKILSGFLKTVWAGRFDVLLREPLFIVDGAHNPDAAVELGKTITDYFDDKKIIFLMGVFKDKDYPAMIEQVISHAKAFITFTIDSERALAGEVLAGHIRKHFKNVVNHDKIKEAVKHALITAGKDDVIIAFGSLSYIGELGKTIKAEV